MQLVVYLDMADGQVVLVTTESLGGGSPVRSVYFVAEQDPEKDKAIIGEMMAPNEKVAMVVSSPMSAQANGEPAAIVPATIQMPKAMIPTEIKNENVAFMLASIPKKSIGLVLYSVIAGSHRASLTRH